MSRLETLRGRADELRAQIDQYRERGSALLSEKTLTTDQRAEIQSVTEKSAEARNDLALVKGQIIEEEQAEARSDEAREASVAAGTNPTAEGRGKGGAKVIREERTYTAQKAKQGQASFFSDFYRSEFSHNRGAKERMERHLREVEVEGEYEGRGGADTESRATTTSSFAGMVVPQYLVDDYALLLRLGRPTANIVNRLPLPDQGMSLIIPRGTTGASTASQATENTALSSTDEVWANLTVPVVTIGGQQDVSRQSLERGTPGIDSIVFMDLLKSYNMQVDTQVLNGSGSSGQMLGILNTGSIGKQTVVYGAAVTPTTFYLKGAGALSTVASAGSAVVPQYWVMHPRRWYWLIAQVDSQGRPLAIPNVNGVFNAMAVNLLPGGYSGDGGDQAAKIVGVYHGLPVVLDANVPVNLGVGTNEDPVIAMDNTEAYLWEANGGIPREMKFEQTLAPNLTIKLVLFNYLAFTAGRYPQAFYQVGGVESAGAGAFGQIPPSF
jgi:HK97 family phage major capsid protein